METERARAGQESRASRYETFGHEAVGQERAAILHVVRVYAEAITQEAWSEACALQSRDSAKIFRRNGRSCEDLVRSLVMGLPAYRRGFARPRVTRVRVSGAKAIAFFAPDHDQERRIALKYEDSDWKIGTMLYD